MNKKLIYFLQDGVEFSTPRIHTPYYEVSKGCFADTEDLFKAYDTSERLNQPLHAVSSAGKMSGSSTTGYPLTTRLLTMTLMMTLAAPVNS